MPDSYIVPMRLLRADAVPATNPTNDAYEFGLQDKKQNIVAGRPQDDGTLAFDFTLTAKPKPGSDRPHFTGALASGPADDRFVYLAWRSVRRGEYINRVKARLSSIDWALVKRAAQADEVLVADMTGWRPGDTRKFVLWHSQPRHLSN